MNLFFKLPTPHKFNANLLDEAKRELALAVAQHERLSFDIDMLRHRIARLEGETNNVIELRNAA